MSLTGHDLLPTDCDPQLPRQTIDALVELGIACNRVAVMINHAQALENSAWAEVEAAIARNTGPSCAQQVADQLASCAISFGEQLIAVYAGCAAQYAAYATAVATAVLAGRTPAGPGPTAAAPSQVFTEHQRLVPLVQAGEERLPEGLKVDQNATLARRHHELMEIIGERLVGIDVTGYDDPQAVHRQPGSVGLPVEYPAALHSYAAAVTWTTALITSSQDQRPSPGRPTTAS